MLAHLLLPSDRINKKDKHVYQLLPPIKKFFIRAAERMKDHISDNLDGFDFSVPLATKQDLHKFLLNAAVTKTLNECYRHATEYQRLKQKRMKLQSDFYPYPVRGLRWLLAFAGLQKTEDGRLEKSVKNIKRILWNPIVSHELQNSIDREIR